MAPTPTNGKICYLEIPTTDIDRSVSFYHGVFGWQTRRRGDGATATGARVGCASGVFWAAPPLGAVVPAGPATPGTSGATVAAR